jgi:hypothetical protein
MTIWTPKTEQVETWSEQAPAVRVFDPNVFDLSPTFDTGSPSGLWTTNTEQQEVWTAA